MRFLKSASKLTELSREMSLNPTWTVIVVAAGWLCTMEGNISLISETRAPG